MSIPRLDREIGIGVYATKSKGIGGRLRQFPDNFRVEENLTNGSRATIETDNIPSITGHGRYLICVLVKRNIDTFQAVQTIADRLGVSTERIQIGGIKDANAVTAQHISISRMLPEQAAQIKTRNLWLYPLQFSNEKITSALLQSNSFCINIRNITHSTMHLAERLELVTQELADLGGYANFFGHQRFGTTRAITHLVGKHILHGEWKEAALIFLAKPSLYERSESRSVRQQLWDTGNYEDALRQFPTRLIYERQMLTHLARQSRDFLGAFHRLPIKLCQLFVQAYQSYLFNRFLSQRILQEMPLGKPQLGDFRLMADGMEHLALPLIGYKQTISQGRQGEIEKRILEEEAMTSENFRISAMPRIASSGGLRIALAPIIDLSFGKPSKDEANPNKRKVSFSFALKKGCYATVVLREFMKPRNPVNAGF